MPRQPLGRLLVVRQLWRLYSRGGYGCFGDCVGRFLNLKFLARHKPSKFYPGHERIAWYNNIMTTQEVKDRIIRGVARSMEVEGADYQRVLKRMQRRIKAAEKKNKES